MITIQVKELPKHLKKQIEHIGKHSIIGTFAKLVIEHEDELINDTVSLLISKDPKSAPLPPNIKDHIENDVNWLRNRGVVIETVGL